MELTAHCLVKNEARFVWYSVESIAAYVDRVLLWDTGSEDGTIDILKKLKSKYKNKIDLNLLSPVSAQEFPEVRAEMLAQTKTDWFIVVDGDEIWWDDSIRQVREIIDKRGKVLESVVVPTVNLVGDIFHYQEPAAGKYRLAGRKGHFNLRAVNRAIPGLASNKPHGTWGWVDGSGKMIQDRSADRICFIEAPYMHATFLCRAGDYASDKNVPKRAKKRKYELGIPVAYDFYYPEAFFRPRPEIVESPWQPIDMSYILRAAYQTPAKKVKRRLLPDKVGY